MNELALFAGAGGGLLAGRLLGWDTICAVEINDYARRVLLARQRDGILPRFPIWDDVRTFDGKPWRGRVNLISAGFPCTGLSAARTNNPNTGQPGLSGGGSELFFEIPRIVEEIQPEFVWMENSPRLCCQGIEVVLSVFNALGYDARWCVLGCQGFGADHPRQRVFILAHANGSQSQGRGVSSRVQAENPHASRPDWWENQPELERVAYGMADQMDRLKAIGNGQVPAVVRLAWEVLNLHEPTGDATDG